MPGGSKAKEEGTTHLRGEAAVVAAEEIRAGRGDGNSSGLLGRWRRQAEGWRIAQPGLAKRALGRVRWRGRDAGDCAA